MWDKMWSVECECADMVGCTGGGGGGGGEWRMEDGGWRIMDDVDEQTEAIESACQREKF